MGTRESNIMSNSPISIFLRFSILLNFSYFWSTRGNADGRNQKFALENIRKSIDLSEKLIPFNPFTLRLVNFDMDTRARELIQDAVRNHPRITGSNSSFLAELNPDTRQTRNKKYFRRALAINSLFTLVYASCTEEFPLISKIINETVNPRLDFFLLIIDPRRLGTQRVNGDYIAKWFPAMGRLLHKIVLNFGNASEVWVEPLNYSKMFTVVGLNKVPSEPSRNPRLGYNLDGRFFRSSISQTPPYCYEIKGSTPNEPSKFKGMFLDLLENAAEKFNFTFFVKNDGSGYGQLLENGTWKGKYSRIYYPESGYDIAIFMAANYIMQRGDRSSAISTIYVYFIMGVPKKKPVPWYGFLEPFAIVVWILTCGTFCVIGILHAIVFVLLYKRQSLSDVFNVGVLLTFSIALEQTGYKVPEKLRVYGAIWILSCVVLGTAYKSQLNAHLMHPNADRIPTTFEDLGMMEHFKITLYVVGKIEHDFFLRSELPLMQKLRRRIQVEADKNKCILSSLMEKNRVCISWSSADATVAQTMTLSSTVDPILRSNDYVLLLYAGLGFQQNSIFSDAFELICSSAYEMGLMTKWEEQTMYHIKSKSRKQLMKENPKTSLLIQRLMEIARGVGKKVPLKMEGLKAVFGILIVGGLLGLLSLSLEYVVGRKAPIEGLEGYLLKDGGTRELIHVRQIINGGQLLKMEMSWRNRRRMSLPL